MTNAHGGGNGYEDDCPICVEEWERDQVFDQGSPGVHPMLSRAQVRAVLGPLLKQNMSEKGHGGDFYESLKPMQNAMVRACARALLALAPDAPSPLAPDEEEPPK